MDYFQCTEADWDHLIEFLDAYCSFDEPVLDIFSMVSFIMLLLICISLSLLVFKI